MLYINTHIIEKEGYRAFEKPIVIHPVSQETCIEKSCGSFIQKEMKPNGHVIIATEVSVEKIINKKNEHVLMTCNVIDFPVHISLLGENFRYHMHGKNKFIKISLTLRYQTYEGFPQWSQFFRNNF